MTQILTFNPAAAGIIGNLSRLRLNKKTRGGNDYAALRPSHRVKGSNPMLKVEQIEGEETKQAELTDEILAKITGVPPLKNQTTYLMFDIGYGWWTLRGFEGEVEGSTEPLVTVTKASARKAKTVPVTDGQPATPSEAVTEAIAEVLLEVADNPEPVQTNEVTAGTETLAPVAEAEATVTPVVLTAEDMQNVSAALDALVAAGTPQEETSTPAATESTAALPSANDDDEAQTTPAPDAAEHSATEDEGLVTHVIQQ